VVIVLRGFAWQSKDREDIDAGFLRSDHLTYAANEQESRKQKPKRTKSEWRGRGEVCYSPGHFELA